MDHYAGIDVSLEQSSVCVVDGSGNIVREAKVASEPAALIEWFRSLGLRVVRIGLEAGPLSQWLFAAMKEAGWEIASHSLKWVEHKDMSEAEERVEIADAIRLHAEVTGQRPLGWYTGRTSINTIRLLMEAGGFLYLCDSYADDLPYWIKGPTEPQLIIPYTLDANDMRFVNAQGFGGGDQFFAYLKDSFDVLYAEGATSPKMMSVGLHDRLIGRPGRAAGLMRFLDHVLKHDRVWICTGRDIAEHWIKVHPFAGR